MNKLDLSNAEELIREWQDPEGAVSVLDMHKMIHFLLRERAKLEAVRDAAVGFHRVYLQTTDINSLDLRDAGNGLYAALKAMEDNNGRD